MDHIFIVLRNTACIPDDDLAGVQAYFEKFVNPWMEWFVQGMTETARTEFYLTFAEYLWDWRTEEALRWKLNPNIKVCR